jgi:hypothetical protein
MPDVNSNLIVFRGTPDAVGWQHAQIYQTRDFSAGSLTYASSLSFYTENKSSGTTNTSTAKMIINSTGGITLGSTSGTGTGALYSGAITSSGGITVNGAVANGFNQVGSTGNPAYASFDQSVNNAGKRWRVGHTGSVAGFTSFDIYNQTDSITAVSFAFNGAATFSGYLFAGLGSSATSSIVYFNTVTGAITYGAVSGLISAGNGLSYSSGVMSLGNTLTATATITAASTFQLSIVGVNTTALNASNFPFISTGYITTTGTETAQYASAGVFAALHMDTASGTFTPFANSKHAGLSATVYKTSAGIYAGILPAVLGTVELAGSGNVTTAAALRALYPALTSGQTYTGTITNAVGLYIDDFSLTSGLTITNKYSIYQAGATDMNYFNGNITMNGAITMASGSNKSIGQSQLSAGTVTVSNSRATASSILIVTRKTPSGTLGFLSYTVSAGTFTINSSNAADTSFVIWKLIN